MYYFLLDLYINEVNFAAKTAIKNKRDLSGLVSLKRKHTETFIFPC